MNKLKLFACLVLTTPLLVHAAKPVRQEFLAVVTSIPDPVRGEELFRHCVSCHSADGGGVVEGSTPRIAGQHFRVLARQLVDFRRGQRHDFRMEVIAGNHEALPELQDIADVASFVSRLERDGKRGVGDGRYVERGSMLYSALCAKCHGANGEGDDIKEIPRLSGQHSAYLSRQIYDAVDGRRSPLSATHGKRLSHLSFEDVLGISDFLARVGWQHEPEEDVSDPAAHSK
ncbi:MAG: c-type cytochrome [Pseudomonadota bacterium]